MYTKLLRPILEQVIDHFRKLRHLKVMSSNQTDGDIFNSKRFAESNVEDKIIRNRIETEVRELINMLPADQKEVILITEEQVNNFAGNMLEVKGADDKRYLVMSTSAHQSLTPKQIKQLEKHAEILSSSLDTIEACGGGSARCMMAEIFLPKKD